MTVQSNTLGGAPSNPSPQGGIGLATASQGFFGTPTDQVSSNNGGHSFDMIFGLPNTVAMSFNPLVFDFDATDAAGTADIRIYDALGNLGPAVQSINVASFTNPTTFFGVVAMPGDFIGRINIHATSVGADTNLSNLISGADNIDVYTPVPEPSLGLLLGISLVGLVGVGVARKIKQGKVTNA